MKQLVAIVRPEQLPAVKEELARAELHHLTASTVMGTAPKTEQRIFRGVRREISLFRRVRIELFVHDAQVETAITAISKGCLDSGGFGKIFITELVDVVKIWTGERGSRAL
ncbi:MAG: P-II family nitrogen regulator [Acidobacteriota bacterium]